MGRIQFLLWGVESKAMLGFLWCSAAQSKKGRGIWDNGSARTVFGPVKEMLSVERRAMRGMGKREPALVSASESLQYKEGWEEGQAKARQHSKQMVVE